MNNFNRGEILQALRERSRVTAEILAPHFGLRIDVPDLSRLIDLGRLVEVLAKSTTRQFTVPRNPNGTARCTLRAQELLDLVYGEPCLMWLPHGQPLPLEVQLDSRLRLLGGALSRRNLLGLSRSDVDWRIRNVPVEFADQFNAVLDDLRHQVRSREFARRHDREKLNMRESATDLRRYFTTVVKSCPGGWLLRFELHQRGLARSVAYGLAYDNFARTLRGFFDQHKESIGGLAWKVDFNAADLFHAHVVAVMVGGTRTIEGALLQDLQNQWARMAGDDAFVLHCSTPGQDMRFRFSSLDFADCDLWEALHRVATYMAATDSVYSIDAGIAMPSSGHGSPPAVHAWPVNHPDNVPRGWNGQATMPIRI